MEKSRQFGGGPEPLFDLKKHYARKAQQREMAKNAPSVLKPRDPARESQDRARVVRQASSGSWAPNNGGPWYYRPAR